MATYNLQHTGSQLDEAISKVESGYADVSRVDATAGDVRQGKKIVNASGQEITGTLVPGITPSGTKTITTNGDHDVSEYAAAHVAVSGASPVLQSKTVSPSESQQNVVPDSGYDGLSQVTVEAVPTETKTATPSESQQIITPTSGKFLSSVTVGAIASNYIGSGVTRKSAQTYTPGTTDQTIAAGQYLSGTQTVKGDANLIPANIAQGVSIFGVAGSHSGGPQVQTYTGTFTPDDNGLASVNCGFTPDIVVFDVFRPYAAGTQNAADRAVASFMGLPDNTSHSSYFFIQEGAYSGGYNFYSKPKSGGFDVAFYYFGWNFTYQEIPGSVYGPVSYTAYKFT